MLSRLVITFLPRSKHLLISWLQSPSAVILEPQKIKSDTVSTVSASIFHEVMGPDAMIFVFWMLSFKPTFSLSSFTFIKRLFSSSSLKINKSVKKKKTQSPKLLRWSSSLSVEECATCWRHQRTPLCHKSSGKSGCVAFMRRSSTFWMAQMAMQETRVQSLSQEDPLEEGMATHSSILAWRIPWTEEPRGYRVRHDWATNTASLTNEQKIGLKIYWVWPCPPEQDPVFPKSVTPIRKFTQASYPHPSEGRQKQELKSTSFRMKSTVTET